MQPLSWPPSVLRRLATYHDDMTLLCEDPLGMSCYCDDTVPSLLRVECPAGRNIRDPLPRDRYHVWMGCSTLCDCDIPQVVPPLSTSEAI